MNLPTIAQGNLRAHGARDRHRTGDQIPASGDTPAAMRLGLNGAARRRLNGGLHRGRRSGGFTLVEMLVSLAITLIMMGAVVTLFGVISESVAGSRTSIEMADRLRAARDQLQLDLQGATATMNPPLRPEMDEGYFEIIEGVSRDDRPRFYGQSFSVRSALAPTVFPPASWSLFGDTDDVLMFTVRNRSAPFLGKATLPSGAVTTIESPVAEVIYFLVQDGPSIDASVTNSGGTPLPTNLCTLYRRVLLISPSVGNYRDPPLDYCTNNDLSVRYRVISPGPPIATEFIPNTLGDLTKRENRFAHYGRSGAYATFPFLVDTTISPTVPFAAVTYPSNTDFATINRPEANAFLAPFSGPRLGDDVLLTNVLAFDVRVWDPTAPSAIRNGIATEPGDAGWVNPAVSGDPIGSLGAYVDLGYYDTTPALSDFARANPDEKPVVLGAAGQRIYDTWSLHYENDGIDQDNANGPDSGTDGLDNNNNGLVDELAEYDTLPPYLAPLRGIRVTIRVYEPNSKTVREAVVIQNFDTK